MVCCIYIYQKETNKYFSESYMCNLSANLYITQHMTPQNTTDANTLNQKYKLRIAICISTGLTPTAADHKPESKPNQSGHNQRAQNGP